MHFQMLSSIRGLYPLNASSTHQSNFTCPIVKMSLCIGKCPLRVHLLQVRIMSTLLIGKNMFTVLLHAHRNYDI